MADVVLGKKEGYHASDRPEPIQVVNGTDTVQLTFADDYSKLSVQVTSAAGAVSYYDVALTAR